MRGILNPSKNSIFLSCLRLSLSMSSPGETASRTLRRIYIEIAEMKKTPSPFWSAAPLDEEEPYEWHFTLRGPSGTDFSGGIYHGKLTLPMNYPFAPPSISLMTPNGRFEEGKKICLSISNFHPELWQPAWGIRTMMEALRSFFPTPADGAVGGLDWPSDIRVELAKESVSWVCPNCLVRNSELIKLEEPVEVVEPVLTEVAVEALTVQDHVQVESPCHSDPLPRRVQRSVVEQLMDSFGPVNGPICLTLMVDVHILGLAIFVIWVAIDILINPPKSYHLLEYIFPVCKSLKPQRLLLKVTGSKTMLSSHTGSLRARRKIGR